MLKLTMDTNVNWTGLLVRGRWTFPTGIEIRPVSDFSDSKGGTAMPAVRLLTHHTDTMGSLSFFLESMSRIITLV